MQKVGFMPLNMACEERVNLLNLAIKFVKASLKPKLPINKQIIISQPVNGEFIPHLFKSGFCALISMKTQQEDFPWECSYICLFLMMVMASNILQLLWRSHFKHANHIIEEPSKSHLFLGTMR